jgi:hypothetical protein
VNDDTTSSGSPESFQAAPPEPAPNRAPDAPAAPTTGTARTAGLAPAATEPAQTVPVRSGRGPSRAATWVNIALGVALVAAVGGVAFAAGRMTAPATAAAGGLGRTGTGFRPGNGYFGDGGGAGGFNGNGGPGGRGGFFGADGGVTIQGTVESSSPDALTIKTASGQTIQVAVNGTTTYHAETSASSSDVKTGGTVIVRVGLRQPGEAGTTTGPTASDVTVVP